MPRGLIGVWQWLLLLPWAGDNLGRWRVGRVMALGCSGVYDTSVDPACTQYCRTRGRLDHPNASNARSIDVGIIERFLWAPCHINRHWEHHLCPAVPTYNLSLLTARLASFFPSRQRHNVLKVTF